MTILLIVYGAVLTFMSVISFFLFLRDKRLAKNGSIRIKEKVLLGFTALGGAVGSLFGSMMARHKTDKVYFSIVIYTSLILQLAVLVLMTVLMFI